MLSKKLKANALFCLFLFNLLEHFCSLATSIHFVMEGNKRRESSGGGFGKC